MSAVPRQPSEDFFELKELSDEAKQLAEWAGTTKKKSGRGLSASKWSKALSEAATMMRTGNWESAEPVHFVAAYATLFEKVYGVECADLASAQTRLYACGFASRLLSTNFGDDVVEFVEFVRWTWSREKERDTWRRANGRSGGTVVGWRLQFGGAFVTEFRVDRARKRGT